MEIVKAVMEKCNIAKLVTVKWEERKHYDNQLFAVSALLVAVHLLQ